MKISELITKLQALQSLHGDIPVVIDDADTNWWLELTYEPSLDHHKKIGNVIVLSADYSNWVVDSFKDKD